MGAVLVLGILESIVITIVRGFVLTKLWLWFVLPIFDVSPLNIVQAIGLAIVVSFLSKNQRSEMEKNYMDEKYSKMDDRERIVFVITYFISSVGTSFIVLGVSWIVKLFM